MRYWMRVVLPVTVRLPEPITGELDGLTEVGMCQSRSVAIRATVRNMLKRELWRTEETHPAVP